MTLAKSFQNFEKAIDELVEVIYQKHASHDQSTHASGGGGGDVRVTEHKGIERGKHVRMGGDATIEENNQILTAIGDANGKTKGKLGKFLEENPVRMRSTANPGSTLRAADGSYTPDTDTALIRTTDKMQSPKKLVEGYGVSDDASLKAYGKTRKIGDGKTAGRTAAAMHELGHHVAHKLASTDSKFASALRGANTGTAGTKYGKTNSQEFFAEAFAAKMVRGKSSPEQKALVSLAIKTMGK